MIVEPSAWLPRYASGYSFLQRSERRAISDFVLLWSLFEAQVLSCRATAGRMLQAVAQWGAMDLLRSERIDESWKYFLDRLKDGANVSYRFEALNLTNEAHRTFLVDAVLSDTVCTATQHGALAIVIHRLRNNLLHGEKWSYGLADQERNFRHASHVLMIWMDLNRVHPFEPSS